MGDRPDQTIADAVPVEPPPRGGRSAETAADMAVVARGGLLNLAGIAVAAVGGFLLTIIVTRGVGTSEAGIFFESVALFFILSSVAQWGSEVGVVRMIPRYRILGRSDEVADVIKVALAPVFLAGCLLGVALFSFADAVGDLLTSGGHADALGPVLRILAPFLPAYAVYTVGLAATRGFGSMVPTNVIDRLGRAAAQPVLILAAIAAGLGTTWIALAWSIPILVASAATAVWMRAIVRRRVTARREASSRPSSRVWREFWRFASPRGLAGVFAVATLWMNTLFIGAIRGPSEAAMFAAAVRYVTFGQLIGLAISQVLAPKLSELIAGDRPHARSLYASATWWLIALAWPLYLTMIIAAPALLSVFGGSYQDAQDVVMILGLAMLLATAVGPVDMVLLMAGKSSWNLVNTIVALVVNVILNLALIPSLGINGAAIAWAASIALNNLLPLAEVWWSVGLHPFGTGSVAAAGASCACFAGVMLGARWLFGDSLAVAVMAGVVASAIYAGALWRLRGVLHLDAFRSAIRPDRGPAPTGAASG